MNGRDLTLGLVGVLAVGAALGKRGSRAKRPASTQELPLDLPAVLYHGSSRSDLVTLTPSRSGALGPGIYLATEPEEGLRWAGWKGQIPDHAPTVYRVRAEIYRPYLWRSDDGAQHPDRVNERARREGYDAIVRRTMDGSIPELVVFDPAQIVSMEPASGAMLERRGSRATDLPSSPAFRRWFGESKVVDAAGRPLIVYHGSPDVRELVQQGFRKSALRGHSYFATARYDMANSYADPHRATGDYQQVEEGVVPLYLSIQNPMVLDGHGKPWRGTEPAVEQARAAGHDGLIIHHSEDWYHGPPKRKAKPTRANPYPNAGTVYIWFSPTQAKSAATAPLLSRTDRAPIAGSGPNVGTWDPNDARLSYNRSAR